MKGLLLDAFSDHYSSPQTAGAQPRRHNYSLNLCSSPQNCTLQPSVASKLLRLRLRSHRPRQDSNQSRREDATRRFVALHHVGRQRQGLSLGNASSHKSLDVIARRVWTLDAPVKTPVHVFNPQGVPGCVPCKTACGAQNITMKET